MAIKDLRIMRRGVDVTVVVGSNEYGGEVLAKVTFTREQLKEVLAPLEKLAYQTAMSVLTTSVTQKEINTKVSAELVRRLEPEKVRIRANARSIIEAMIKTIDRELGPVDKEATPRQVVAIRNQMNVARTALANTFKAAS